MIVLALIQQCLRHACDAARADTASDKTAQDMTNIGGLTHCEALLLLNLLLQGCLHIPLLLQLPFLC